jgi:uncharacterized membrane protein (UPF0127 family)
VRPNPEDPDFVEEGPAPSLALVIGVGCVLVGIVLVGVAFVRSSGEEPSGAATTTTSIVKVVDSVGLAAGTTAPLGSAGLGEGVGPAVAGRTPLRGFSEAAVTVTKPDGEICELCLMAATTEAQRERGLMEVTDEDLGGYDGMIFEYPVETDGSFWMRNTPTPLSIAFFDEQGEFVSSTDMEPCGDDPSCPGYPAGGAFRFAIEVPKGMLDEINAVDGSTLRIHARRCPLASPGG